MASSSFRVSLFQTLSLSSLSILSTNTSGIFTPKRIFLKENSFWLLFVYVI